MREHPAHEDAWTRERRERDEAWALVYDLVHNPRGGTTLMQAQSWLGQMWSKSVAGTTRPLRRPEDPAPSPETRCKRCHSPMSTSREGRCINADCANWEGPYA